jgi:hypothetical protein
MSIKIFGLATVVNPFDSWIQWMRRRTQKIEMFRWLLRYIVTAAAGITRILKMDGVKLAEFYIAMRISVCSMIWLN